MFCKKIIELGGSLHPLLIDSEHTGGTGLMNPSVFVDGDRLLVNIRHVGYTLYHSEKKTYHHPWGPVQYLHPEDDMHLRTINYLGELNDDLSQKYITKVDTSDLDKEPLWDFVGLEDARVVRWNEKLYLCGVRRDTTVNGQGRMELSEIVEENNSFKEVSRFRIPTLGDDSTYCEKNWMPILDMPFHYVKWCNPTQIVKVDPIKGTTEEVFVGKHIPSSWDFRGGSQVLTYKGYRFCIVHQCELWKIETGKRDARYRHRIIVWDKDWNVVKYGEPFSFLEGEIEFCCGAALWKNDLLISFGFQDNSAFVLRVPENILDEIIGIKESPSTIVDFFPYFDATGKELLELRYHMLKDVVDKFIICESNKTQSGIPIEYGLEKTLNDLNIPQEKVQVIKLEIPNDSELEIQEIDKINCYESNSNNINSVRARARERLQKDSLLKVIDEYKDNTVFIVSDQDEIINPEKINFVVQMVKKHQDVVIKIPLVQLEGKANLRVYNVKDNTPRDWSGGMFLCLKHHLKKATPCQIRSNVFNPYRITHLMQDNQRIEDIGWHFSWMGNNNHRQIKLDSFCHYDDTGSHLENKSYKNNDVRNNIINCELEENKIPPCGDITAILKVYPLNDLPKQIFELPQVKNYLLPNKILQAEDIINDTHLNDIIEHLPVLTAIGNKCKHITELGVRTGHSTRAFLKTNAILRSYDIEKDAYVEKLFLTYQKQNKDVKYIIGDSTKIDIEQTDLLFIDTQHTYLQLKTELLKHCSSVKKYIILHDTYTYGMKDEVTSSHTDKQGLLPAIIEFLIENPAWKFKEFKTNNNGLTILEKCE